MSIQNDAQEVLSSTRWETQRMTFLKWSQQLKFYCTQNFNSYFSDFNMFLLHENAFKHLLNPGLVKRYMAFILVQATKKNHTSHGIVSHHNCPKLAIKCLNRKEISCKYEFSQVYFEKEKSAHTNLSINIQKNFCYCNLNLILFCLSSHCCQTLTFTYF